MNDFQQIEFCKVPGCTSIARTTWAMVPLCAQDFEGIRKETAKFYAGNGIGTEEAQRPLYNAIAYRIPWSKKNLSEGGGEHQ